MHGVALLRIAASLALVLPAAAHTVFIDTVGDAGRARGYGLGVDFKICRNTGGTNCQRDTTVFGPNPFKSWSGCGKTHMQADRAIAGAEGFDPPERRDVKNNPAIQVPKMIEQGAIPLASPGGYLNITTHQINADGAGPFVCGVDPTGTGARYTRKLPVIQQAPGVGGIFAENSLKRVPLRVRLPNDLKCTGKFGSKRTVCMIRCQNPAANGPFGACFPVELKAVAPPDA